MEILKDYLLHICFILFPILLYQVFWLGKPSILVPKINNGLVTLFACGASVLCIIFPIQEMDYIQYGLQIIPVIICLFYINTASGLTVAASVLCFELLFFEPSAIFVFTLLPFHIIIPILLQKKWPFMSKARKLLLSLFIGCLEIFLFFASILVFSAVNILNFQNSESLYYEAAVSGLFRCIVLLLSIYIIESIAENIALRSQLIHSEKMEIVSELAASVAHEVRNPLTVVRGFVQLLFNDESFQNKSSADYKKLVLSELDRAQGIITNYLDIAKQQLYEKEIFDLSSLIRETSSLMISYANYKSVTVEADAEPDLLVYGDATKLKQAVINLMKNSIEAVPPGKGVIQVSAKRSGHMIVIKISDNGVGMTDHQMQKLGEPYYSLKTNGTGLGLTVTFSIIEHHHGTISFSSSFQRGTIVTIKLPADLPH
ncbi:two-component sensor histidine kinase [Bacillus halotolerans]|uniref:histidine kinase n=1 Tax=Bacillus halotolerans TaxID=260554 RepID=A0A9Q6AB51_9BACI|nr:MULTISPECIES: HAMP domain-containing sensor histidine kinase [Bacillus]MBV7320775.1 HAMP domain-containing histidine kinase [Halalkalibacterium halodurans]MBU5244121.1 HAMP domain-containing histidine kinase [Bacillus halotolerans]MCM3354959.1 HAMP domain-containing histidine kinase [Bacillus halotolerans]MCP9297298.1 HAMP domain-containing histidine kinase [Bacillus halotolerans]MCV0026149.1 HAMP domain-containing histidine kinase [Bacillus sp. XT-2]